MLVKIQYSNLGNPHHRRSILDIIFNNIKEKFYLNLSQIDFLLKKWTENQMWSVDLSALIANFVSKNKEEDF